MFMILTYIHYGKCLQSTLDGGKIIYLPQIWDIIELTNFALVKLYGSPEQQSCLRTMNYLIFFLIFRWIKKNNIIIITYWRKRITCKSIYYNRASEAILLIIYYTSFYDKRIRLWISEIFEVKTVLFLFPNHNCSGTAYMWNFTKKYSLK